MAQSGDDDWRNAKVGIQQSIRYDEDDDDDDDDDDDIDDDDQCVMCPS